MSRADTSFNYVGSSFILNIYYLSSDMRHHDVYQSHACIPYVTTIKYQIRDSWNNDSSVSLIETIIKKSKYLW